MQHFLAEQKFFRRTEFGVAQWMGNGRSRKHAGRAHIDGYARERADLHTGNACAFQFFGHRCAATGACASGAGEHRPDKSFEALSNVGSNALPEGHGIDNRGRIARCGVKYVCRMAEAFVLQRA